MKLTLAKKLYAAFGFVILMLGIGGLLVWNLKLVGEQHVERGRQATLATAALADAQSALWALRWGVAQFVAVSDPAVRAKISGESAKLRADLDQALKQFEGTGLSEDERKLTASLRTTFESYSASRAKWMQLMADGKTDEATKERADVTTPMGGATVKAFSGLIELQRKGSSADAQFAGRALAEWGYATIAFLLLAALVASTFVVWVVGSITRPLHEAVRVAQRVAAGDLSSHIDVTSSDETGELLAALKTMNASLARIVASVREGSDSIASGSAQISSGNTDLSQRTEEQASNLQQTAASMAQLTSTVKTSADTARQATQLAGSASAAAAKGGELVGQVVSTMDAIAAGSKKIGDITGVIDSIAFQTNILALNAAVEAARAGPQGRGFAVVASEVRNLAQRSAEAAKEIKSLIGASVEKVEAGSRLVGDAGAQMHDIVAQVKRVADLIDEISAATTEQTSGIGQINNAVSQLDQATQQNAALVEQSAAAADSLSGQAARLVQTVAVFKLTEGPVQAPPAHQVAAREAIAKAKSASVDAVRAPAKPSAPTPIAKVAKVDTIAKVAKVAKVGEVAKVVKVSRPAEPLRSSVAPVAPSAKPAGAADDEWETF